MCEYYHTQCSGSLRPPEVGDLGYSGRVGDPSRQRLKAGDKLLGAAEASRAAAGRERLGLFLLGLLHFFLPGVVTFGHGGWCGES